MTGLELTTGVLVVGGGPAATSWAAFQAAQGGADVVLADKVSRGTSGATASAGTGVWYVPPEPAAREAAMASRQAWADPWPTAAGWRGCWTRRTPG